MRGEDSWSRCAGVSVMETPPRAWGRPMAFGASEHSGRNTPTCVGKTLYELPGLLVKQKHPHVRGEDFHAPDTSVPNTETPPRAWGRPARAHCPLTKLGNTPTCVGKTGWCLLRSCRSWKHPHVRGEDLVVGRNAGFDVETPPRAWGRQHTRCTVAMVPGNTPTCVGKTATASALKFSKHYR